MSDETKALAQAAEDFRLYLTFTEEMLKFLSRGDIEEFFSLQGQRDALVARMKANPATEAYRKEASCQAIVGKIKPLEMQIIYKAKAWLNKSRRQNASVRSYNLTALDVSPAGNLLNRNS